MNYKSILTEDISKNYNFIRKVLSYDELELIINKLKKIKRIVNYKEIVSLVFENVNIDKYESILDFLLDTHAISKIYSNKINSMEIEEQYISNLNTNSAINYEITEILELRVKSAIKKYSFHDWKVDINNLKADYRSYTISSIKNMYSQHYSKKGVILASLFDALISRYSINEKVIMNYFINYEKEIFYLTNNIPIMNLDEISDYINSILKMMKKSNPKRDKYSSKKNLIIESDDYIINNKKNDIFNQKWSYIYNKLSNEGKTENIRKNIINKLNGLFNDSEQIFIEGHRKFINHIVKMYYNNSEDILLNKQSNIEKIAKLINYLYIKNINITNFITDSIQYEYKKYLDIEEFLNKMFQIFFKKYFGFLFRLDYKYSKYFYIFIKSYIFHKFEAKDKFIKSFLLLFRIALNVKLTNRDVIFHENHLTTFSMKNNAMKNDLSF